MLFHYITNSNDCRIIKQILQVQEEEVRQSTWYACLKDIVVKYGIELDVKWVMKSEWKKNNVKEQIHDQVQCEIYAVYQKMKNTRSIKDGNYELQQYMKETTIKIQRDIWDAENKAAYDQITKLLGYQ